MPTNTMILVCRSLVEGIAIAIGVGLFGIAGAAVSIVGRSTQLEKTSQFWGEKTILALQLGERLELRPRGNETFAPLDLSGAVLDWDIYGVCFWIRGILTGLLSVREKPWANAVNLYLASRVASRFISQTLPRIALM